MLFLINVINYCFGIINYCFGTLSYCFGIIHLLYKWPVSHFSFLPLGVTVTQVTLLICK